MCLIIKNTVLFFIRNTIFFWINRVANVIENTDYDPASLLIIIIICPGALFLTHFRTAS